MLPLSTVNEEGGHSWHRPYKLSTVNCQLSTVNCQLPTNLSLN
ncbi:MULTISPECIES: hypothetical protein [unclassified Microcoleus]|nr:MULTISPECIES: hypothetical protein [unclassified Microcoleus]